MKKDNGKISRLIILFLGLVFLVIGTVLFFKSQSLVVVLICAFFGFGLTYVFISKTIYSKRKNEVFDETKVPQQTIIKPSFENFLLYVLGNSVFVAFGGYLIYNSDFSLKKLNFSFVFVLGLVFLLFYCKKLFESFYKYYFQKKQIVLDERGIEFNKKFFPWSEVRNIKIVEKENRDSKYTYLEKFLKFNHKGLLYEDKLENYTIYDFRLEKLIEVYKKRSSKDKVMVDKKNELEEIITYDEFLNTNFEDGEKYLENIRKIAEKHKDKTENYFRNLKVSAESPHILAYNALSEDFPNWEKFLYSEFIRLFELAKTTENNSDIFDVLDEIIPDGVPNSDNVAKVAHYLYQELNNPDDKIRHKAVWHSSFWVDSENYSKFPEIMNRLKSKLQDKNWKIRWITNHILKDYPNISEIKLSFVDKIRGKFGNPYSI